MANAKVFSIQPSDNNDVKRKNSDSKDGTIINWFKTNTPKIIPLRSERITFFEYRANMIANRDGIRERIEFSII